MDARQEFLEHVKELGLVRGHFLGLLNLLIGRRIEKAGGALISVGSTWREVAALLKKVRWDKDAVLELSLDPHDLPPRDRERFWFSLIAQSQVDSEEAVRTGDALAEELHRAGYVVGPAPGRSAGSL